MYFDDEPISDKEKQGYSNEDDQVPKGDDGFNDLLHSSTHLENDENAQLGNEEDQFSKGLSSQKSLTLNPDNKNLRTENGKIVVRYNRYGVHVGPEATALSTFLRVLARVSVPIIFKDWRLVPDNYKEALWSFVQV